MGSAVSASSNSVDESMRRKIEAKVEASAGYTPEQCVKFCADLRAVLAKLKPPETDETAAALKLQGRIRGHEARKKMAACPGAASLEGKWLAYVSFGLGGKVVTLESPAMGISHWHKFLKDHKIFKKRFTKTDSDLIFAKVEKEFEERKKVSFRAFARALELVAAKLGCDMDDLEEIILATGDGPSSTGTIADDVKHARAENFTGVASRGGPTNIDANAMDLSMLTNRSKKSDVRGAVAVSASGV